MSEDREYATHDALPASGECYLPDALYFAHNIGDAPEGRATCMWAAYDAGGRMTDMWTRTGCSSCAFVSGLGSGDLEADDAAVLGASECASRDPEGTYGELGYLPPLDTVRTHYTYSWNGLGQLQGAARYENSHCSCAKRSGRKAAKPHRYSRVDRASASERSQR